MKYLKKFENFTEQDLGDRFSDEVTPMNHYEEEEEKDNFDYRKDFFGNEEEKEEEQTCASCNCTDCECGNEMEDEYDEDEARVWGDELVEKKKINKGFQAYLDKQKSKKEDKNEKGSKKAKPDFLDLDKDGNKKESMKKAAKDAKEDKKEDKKEDNKKPKFGSAEWQKKYGKKK